jgi:hypothetical protein
MYKKTIISMMFVFLVSCASPEQLAREKEINDELSVAKSNSFAICNDKNSCDKAFSLAKIYVHDHADMKIQLSDDTMISTYNPTELGYIALSATKVPGEGESATIHLFASCRDMGGVFKCAQRMINIYREFGTYIARK